jgi:hypothetical protein
VQVCLYKLRSSLSGICILFIPCDFFCSRPKYFYRFLEHIHVVLLYLRKKSYWRSWWCVNPSELYSGYDQCDVRPVNAHSKGLTTFPRDVQENVGAVPRFGQDRLSKNRSDWLVIIPNSTIKTAWVNIVAVKKKGGGNLLKPISLRNILPVKPVYITSRFLYGDSCRPALTFPL